MHKSPKQCCQWFIAIFAIWLLSFGALSIATDPFWVWQKNPAWLGHGHNLNLNVYMRLSKSLQILTRPTDTVIIGDSPVYHGFDFQGHADAYNLGISGIRMREIEGFTSHLLRYKPVKQLVIGLQYRMFDTHHLFEPGYDGRITTYAYLPETILSSFYGWSSVQAIKNRSDKKSPDKGVWQWNGFITSPVTQTVNQDDLRKSVEALAPAFADIDVDDEAYKALERTLALAYADKVQVSVYLSPLHQAQFNALKQDDKMAAFDEWRKEVAIIAARNHANFLDLSHSSFTDEPKLLTTGRSEHWLDPTHFKPEVGDWILQQLGVYQ